MASGINVKMGVTGVAQFKQSMKESQAAVKNLDQQLKLNEAQLKLTGNEELALENKTALLTKQIEEQKNVVKQANSALEAMQRNGVSKTSVEFQKMQQQVYKASTDLMTMQAELQNVGESGEDAQSGVSHMNQALQRIGTNVSFQSVTEGIEKITGTLEKAATAAWNLGKKIVQATLGGAAWADELQTEADVWQIPAEELYRMRETARIIDTDAETILQARDKLKKGREESGKEFMGSLAYLHIDPNGMSDIDLFWKAGEAIAALGKEEDKVHYAQTLFGKSWRELIPLFSAGREEYEKTFAAWDWIGDEQMEKLTTLDDKYQELQSEWQSVQLQFQAQMAEVLTPVMETLTGLLKEFNTYLQSEDGQQMLASLGEAISSLFEDLTNIDPATVINGIKDAIDGVKSGLEWIKNNKDAIKTAIEAIAIAWGGMKLAGLALNVGKIVNGFKQLGWIGGGGAETAATPAATSAAGSSTGGGFLGGLINTITLAAGADAVWKATDGRIKELNREFNEKTAGMTPIEAADFALFHDLGITREELNHWGDSHENEDPMSWTGHGHSFGEPEPEPESWLPAISPFAENLQDYYAEPMDRMTEVASTQNDILPGVQQSSENMTAAATALMDLPGLIQTAIASGMSAISIIIDASGIDAMQPRIAGGISDKLVQMTK